MDVALPDRKEYYDIALLWGHSTPHLNPWEMTRAYAAICHLLNDSGVMAMDETDRIYNIFYRVGYKDFLIEGETKYGLTVATIHMGYDEKRGVFNRTTYTLPRFARIATFGYRFLDLADTYHTSNKAEEENINPRPKSRPIITPHLKRKTSL